MRLFRVNRGLTTYTLPVLKAIASIVVILLVFASFSIHFDSKVIVVAATVFRLMIVCGSIIEIYCALAEMIFVHDNIRIRNNVGAKQHKKQ